MRKSIHLNIIILPSVFLLIVLNCFSAGQERYLHFTEIDGLPRNITTCLEQDQYGYIWIGTNNGIARYDGKDFYGYKELTGIGIIHLLYDSGNSLWASTSKGLYKYNRITNFFELIVQGYIPKIEEDNGSIYFLMNSNIFRVSGHDTTIFFPGSDISDFCFSEEGLWVSKSNDGVSLFGRKNKFNEPRVSFLKNKSVSLIRMIDNKLFVGLFNGELYSIADSSITQVNIKNHYYFEKFEKVGNEIWLATDGNGIIILDENLCFSRKLGKNENEGASINSNSIYDILPGKNEEIWLASFGAGLTCILPDNLLFQNILPEKGNLNSLVANEGVSVLVKEPFVYFGTNYGLSEWNINSGQFVNISSEKLIKDLNGTKVTATNVDRANNIWIGTYDGLMGKYSPGFKLSDIYHPCSTEKGEMQQIIDIIEVGKDNLLVLTQFRSRILLNYNTRNKTSGLFELYTKGSNITYCLLNSLRRNKQGELLAVITDQGLFHVNWNTNVLENRLSEMNSKIDFTITDFYQDENENYWITSSADGLLYITQDGKILKKWSVKDGLPSNTLVRVESTDNRFLWISTISGICRFDTETEEVMNFNHRDGLPANEFQERVSATISDGRIIFGSLAGFTIIDPSKLNPDTSKTEVVISDISFQNQSIRNPDGRQYLTKPLEETKEIKLPYSKNSFSIHYFTKNKSFSKYHNYEYRLVGFDENWVYQGETNYTTYTNLSPGTYAFEIRSADKSQPGITTRLAINIQPPWYLGWYAFLIYILLFFLILYLSIYAFLKRFELFKEKEIAEIKIQQEHELTEKKLAFFTNISHDLKTPLTLIDAPVNDLLQSGNLNRDQLEKLKIVSRNSKRLYKLITDLLDFRKIAQKQYLTEIGLCNISDILADTCEAFKGECKNKSIGLKCNSGNNIVGYVDAKIIEKILWNLLSNSLKFTKKGGTISVCAEELLIEGNKNVKLEVSDNGIGISENDKGKIFDRFFKVQGSGALNKGGTGIGLSIVKELVEIHHGKIKVDSIPGEGTSFIIVLPAEKDFYSESEIISKQGAFQQESTLRLEDDYESVQPSAPGHKQYNLPLILLVEDNSELREYLAGHFTNRFKVFQASDGSEGLQTAKELNPDIILTDVEMPNMNGYEFCEKIRQNFDTSHIPVVMLTANSAVDQQIEGLTTGVDAYITKPFEIKLLDTVLNSILDNRRRLRSKFSGMETPENLEKTLPQKDIDFIFDLKRFIEENIMNQELNIELLTSHFAVSVPQLHRKIKTLIGSTPNNLIKSIRLKKAYKLIKENGCRVAEAAYQTGFSDPNYFTTCFRKEFGENPSRIGG